jgi:hypothetical protein
LVIVWLTTRNHLVKGCGTWADTQHSKSRSYFETLVSKWLMLIQVDAPSAITEANI